MSQGSEEEATAHDSKKERNTRPALEYITPELSQGMCLRGEGQQQTKLRVWSLWRVKGKRYREK